MLSHKHVLTCCEVCHLNCTGMAPFYKSTCEKLGWALDQAFLSNMEVANAEELAKLTAMLEEAETNQGETEVREALLARANFHARIGENAVAIAAYDETFLKTVAMGLRLDILLSKIRVGLFHEDMILIKASIDKAKKLLEEGGDWERRNRLKVYEAVYLIMIREFKKASNLFLDSVATFTATELLPYNNFVLYTVVTSLISLPRKNLKEKIVDAPEILQVHPLSANVLQPTSFSLVRVAFVGIVSPPEGRASQSLCEFSSGFARGP